jgi:hypothetical protein
VSPRGAGAPTAPVHIASNTIARTMRILATVGFEAAVSKGESGCKRLIYHSKGLPREHRFRVCLGSFFSSRTKAGS